ncbi:response regulator [Candidatus Saccharibacteria bacterium]|nr:response regulator [Candidatus Saccharibacteria bacterium]
MKKRARIMILDDNESILELLKIELEEMGFEVWAYTCPSDALTDLINNPMDLIITDLEMPQMDGLSFAKRARLIHKTPIFLFTGNDEVFASEDVAVRFDKFEMQKMLHLIDRIFEARTEHTV